MFRLFQNKIIPFLKRWEKFILGAIDILAITIAFQCSYFINYFEVGRILLQQYKIIKAFPTDYCPSGW